VSGPLDGDHGRCRDREARTGADRTSEGHWTLVALRHEADHQERGARSLAEDGACSATEEGSTVVENAFGIS
jgi:hypothetical protein